MKTNIFSRMALITGCTLALTACDDNSWNDHLTGFESGETGVSGVVETIDYTLTLNDYKTLADNATNKALAEENGLSAELKAVGSQGYFTDKISASQYVPALLTDPKFPYFTLDKGSAIKLTYNEAAALPQQVTQAISAAKMTVSDEQYQQVWESENDYAAAFSQSHPASKFLPRLLKDQYPDAAAGDAVIVNYNQATQEPVFGGISEPEVPGFTQSAVLTNLANGNAIDANAVVMAVSTQGAIVADQAGALFAYRPSNNSDLKVGDQVVFSTVIGNYNNGFQTAQGVDLQVQGTQAVTYPTPRTFTAAEAEAFSADALANGPIQPVYAKFTGTVSISGTFTNIILEGTTAVQLSPYGATDAVKAMLTDGATVELEGYVMAVASKGKFLNTIITKIGTTEFTTLSTKSTRTPKVATVASVNENAIYTYDGSAWAPMTDAVVLNHADYQLMGQKYDNLSGELPAAILPDFLKRTYPYAQTDNVKYVVYYYYNGTETVTRCDEYTYTSGAWAINNGVTTVTAQFVKTDKGWIYDPNVTITLPAGRNQPLSTLYYQTCVDWVAANVPDGTLYVSKYGNNEYYCGTSAYQGNVDLRPSAAKAQYSGYDSMSDAEVVALEKARFESEVMPAALHILHPDAAPIAGLELLYTINFYYYDGTTIPATIVYEVTAPGTFTYRSCTWND